MESSLTWVISVHLRSLLPGSSRILKFLSDLHIFVVIMGPFAVLPLPLQLVWTGWSGGSWFWRRALEKAEAITVVLGLVSCS